MRLVIVASVILGAACGSSAPAATRTTEAPAAAGACPATWADITGGDNGEFCDPDVDGDCSYPEGDCFCGFPRECDRSNRIDDIGVPPPNLPSSWQCDWSAAATRPDGCPGQMLADQACTEDGQQCTYSFPCCNEDVTCRDGTWQRDEGGCDQ